MEENSNELAHIYMLESGMPITQAKETISKVASILEMCSRLHMAPPRHKHTVISTSEKGITGYLPSWYFNIACLFQRITEELFVGSTVVVKAATETPLIYMSIAKLVEEAAFPKGVFNVIASTGDNEAAVREEMYHTEGMYSFTYCDGSSFIKEEYHNRNPVKCCHSFPCIIFDDANVDQAVDTCMRDFFAFSGQLCTSMNQVFVQEGIYDRLMSNITEKVMNLKVGDPMNEGSEVGCLLNSEVVNRHFSLIEDAVSKGATIVCGGKSHLLGGTFVEPTVLKDVNRSMRLFSEDVIGPIVPM